MLSQKIFVPVEFFSMDLNFNGEINFENKSKKSIFNFNQTKHKILTKNARQNKV